MAARPNVTVRGPITSSLVEKHLTVVIGNAAVTIFVPDVVRCEGTLVILGSYLISNVLFCVSGLTEIDIYQCFNSTDPKRGTFPSTWPGSMSAM
jgi:hypothetical protein